MEELKTIRHSDPVEEEYDIFKGFDDFSAFLAKPKFHLTLSVARFMATFGNQVTPAVVSDSECPDFETLLADEEFSRGISTESDTTRSNVEYRILASNFKLEFDIESQQKPEVRSGVGDDDSLQQLSALVTIDMISLQEASTQFLQEIQGESSTNNSSASSLSLTAEEEIVEMLCPSGPQRWSIDAKASISSTEIRNKVTASLNISVAGGKGKGKDSTNSERQSEGAITLLVRFNSLLAFSHLFLSGDSENVLPQAIAAVHATHKELWREEFTKVFEKVERKDIDFYLKMSFPHFRVVILPTAFVEIKSPEMFLAAQSGSTDASLDSTDDRGVVRSRRAKSVAEIVVKVESLGVDPFDFNLSSSPFTLRNSSSETDALNSHVIFLARVEARLRAKGGSGGVSGSDSLSRQRSPLSLQANVAVGDVRVDIGEGSRKISNSILAFESIVYPLRRTDTLRKAKQIARLVMKEQDGLLVTSAGEESIYYSVLIDSIPESSDSKEGSTNSGEYAEEVKKVAVRRLGCHFQLSVNSIIFRAGSGNKILSLETRWLFVDVLSDRNTQFKLRGKMGAVALSKSPFCGAVASISVMDETPESAVLFSIELHPAVEMLRSSSVAISVICGTADLVLDSKNDCFHWPMELVSLFLLDKEVRAAATHTAVRLAETPATDSNFIKHALQRTVYTTRVESAAVRILSDIEYAELGMKSTSVTLEGQNAVLTFTTANKSILPTTLRANIAATSGYMTRREKNSTRRFFYTGPAGVMIVFGGLPIGQWKQFDDSINVTIECPTVHAGLRNDSLMALISIFSRLADLLIHLPEPNEDVIIGMADGGMGLLVDALNSRYPLRSDSGHFGAVASHNQPNQQTVTPGIQMKWGARSDSIGSGSNDAVRVRRGSNTLNELIDEYSPVRERPFLPKNMRKMGSSSSLTLSSSSEDSKETIEENSDKKDEEFTVQWNMGTEEKSLAGLIIVEEHEAEQVISPILANRWAAVHVALVGMNIHIDLGAGDDFSEEDASSSSSDAIEIILGDVHITFDSFYAPLRCATSANCELSHLFRSSEADSGVEKVSWTAKIVLPRVEVVDRVAASQYRNASVLRFGPARGAEDSSSHTRWKLGNDIQILISSTYDGWLFLHNDANLSRVEFSGRRAEDGDGILPRESIHLSVLLAEDPITITLDQDTLEFLIKFSSSIGSNSEEATLELPTQITDQTLFFQSISVKGFNVAVNYTPKHTRLSVRDWRENGTELLKAIPLKNLKLKIPTVMLTGLHEPFILRNLVSRWRREAELFTLVAGVAKGVGGVGSVVHIGEDAMNVFVIPMRELRMGHGTRGALALSTSVARLLRTIAKETGFSAMSSAVARTSMRFLLSKNELEGDNRRGSDLRLREWDSISDFDFSQDSDSETEEQGTTSEGSVASQTAAVLPMTQDLLAEEGEEYDAVIAIKDDESPLDVTTVPINLTDPLRLTFENLRSLSRKNRRYSAHDNEEGQQGV